MNSFTGSASQRNPSSSSASSLSFNSYKFDFGTGSSNSSSSARPLRDQKLNHSPASSNPPSSSSSSRPPSSSPAASSWSPSSAARPSWVHQPAYSPARSGPPNPTPSVVGDIFGRSWSSAAAPPAAGLGIQDKNPNLFSDLVGSAIGQSRSDQSFPLKSAPSKSSFSMAGITDFLPKSNNSNASANNMGEFSSFIQPGSRIGATATGAPMKSAAGTATNSSKTDPFGSLTSFASKPSSNVPLSAGKFSNFSRSSGGSRDPFDSLQNATSAQKPQQSGGREDFSFGGFQNTKNNEFGMPVSSSPLSQQHDDQLDVLLSSTSSTAPCGASSKGQPISVVNDWDVEFGMHESVGTTELEGLPPPPGGVTASAAKSKGLDNYKQGQFADAIKWLSWAVVLLEKSGDVASSNEVLISRASSYKEVGEYKKAIADCSMVLDRDSNNVSVLLQRALLYESSEKYRLGAEDLRAVLKIDPANRLARSTIHRLNQFAD